MTRAASRTARFRRDNVVFDIPHGARTVTCSVTKTAIQEASGVRSNLPDAVLAAFAPLRDRIEAVARRKLLARQAGDSGVLHIWSGDLDEEPEDLAPLATG